MGGCCALLRGPPGAGKSDLALRFLFLPDTSLKGRPELIADDQVYIKILDSKLVASCPPSLSGKLEVRGIGIANVASCPSAELKLVADLDGKAGRERFPAAHDLETILGVPVLRISLDPFEVSAPLKLALLLRGAFSRS